MLLQPAVAGLEISTSSPEGDLQNRKSDFRLELGEANLASDLRTVDSKLGKEGQQLLGTVLRSEHFKELGGIINESGPALSFNEGLVGKKGQKEGNVGLDTSDSKLNEGSEHLSAGNLISSTRA